jgi:hypothetical protein
MSIPADQWLQMLEEAGSEPTGDSRLSRYLQSSYDFPAEGKRVLGRYGNLTKHHLDRFKADGVSTARAPGRVNLIGEHTDYNGLPVFPMAVNRDMAAVFSPRNDRKVVIANTEPGFVERCFDIESPYLPIRRGTGATTARPRCRDCSTTTGKSAGARSASAALKQPSTAISRLLRA